MKKLTFVLFILLVTILNLSFAKTDKNNYRDNYIANYAGTWDTDFGRMKIYQEGRNVYGSYSWYSGTIKGYVDDDGYLFVTWDQDGGLMCSKGQAVFELNSDGNRFYGTWGCGSSNRGGGKWNGQRY